MIYVVSQLKFLSIYIMGYALVWLILYFIDSKKKYKTVSYLRIFAFALFTELVAFWIAEPFGNGGITISFAMLNLVGIGKYVDNELARHGAYEFWRFCSICLMIIFAILTLWLFSLLRIFDTNAIALTFVILFIYLYLLWVGEFYPWQKKKVVSTHELEDRTVLELQSIAKEKQIKGYYKLKKKDLINAIREVKSVE